MQAHRRTRTWGRRLSSYTRTNNQNPAVFAPEVLPLPQPARAPPAPSMWQRGVPPSSSPPWTRALGPTKRGRRGATLSAYPDANEGWAPQPYRFCAPPFLIHIHHLTLSVLSTIHAINANKVFLVALNSCILFADLHLEDFQRLHPGTDHFVSS